LATDKQIEANRLNAQKSTGPKTPEGRAAVRLNGVKHGITAQTLVLKGETEADFTDLLDSYEAEHQPSTPTEEALVQQLAMATWRLRRLYHAEASFHAGRMKEMAHDKWTGATVDDSTCLGLVNHRNKDTMATFHRQESRLERTFYHALHELQRLRKLALVSQADVAQVSGQPAQQINDIHVVIPSAQASDPLDSPQSGRKPPFTSRPSPLI
jgi:hypothetical protein